MQKLSTGHAVVVCKQSENDYTGCIEVSLQVLWILHNENFLFKLQLAISPVINTKLLLTHQKCEMLGFIHNTRFPQMWIFSEYLI